MQIIRTFTFTYMRGYYNEPHRSLAIMRRNCSVLIDRYHLLRGVYMNAHCTNVNLFIISFHLDTNLILGSIIQDTILTVVPLCLFVCVCVERKRYTFTFMRSGTHTQACTHTYHSPLRSMLPACL